MPIIPNSRWPTVVYWEKRRVVFNLVVIAATTTIYQLRVAVSAGVGDTRYLSDLQVGALFIVAWLGANLCFSFVYAMEFLFGLSESPRAWVRSLKPVILIAGCAIGVYLSPSVARDIGGSEYTATWISKTPVEE